MSTMKDAMACFATGVTVVTTYFDNQLWGMTCNSFNTVSLDPAMVLWSIRKQSSSHHAFTQARGYTINILSADQQDVAMRFTKGTQAERFDALPLTLLSGQRARLTHALAWFDCELDNTVQAGDHDILIGRVIEFGLHPQPAADALVYVNRQFGVLQIPSEELHHG